MPAALSEREASARAAGPPWGQRSPRPAQSLRELRRAPETNFRALSATATAAAAPAAARMTENQTPSPWKRRILRSTPEQEHPSFERPRNSVSEAGVIPVRQILSGYPIPTILCFGVGDFTSDGWGLALAPSPKSPDPSMGRGAFSGRRSLGRRPADLELLRIPGRSRASASRGSPHRSAGTGTANPQVRSWG